MHGQNSMSRIGSNNDSQSSPAMGKGLPDGSSMPPLPDSSHHPHSSLLMDRMSSSNTTGPYHMGTGGAGGGDGGSGGNSGGVGDLYNLDGVNDAKRKKGLDEELCRICGDRASGYHYNALSCEGCKGFFRRSITKTANYVCKYGGNCEMDMWMRRKCQACRLRRCREVGMKEECLLSEYQCQLRLERRKKQKVADKKEVVATSPDSNGLQDMSSTSDVKPSKSHIAPSSTSSSSLSSISQPPGDSSDENPLRLMPKEHQEVIRSLMVLQERFEFPDEQDVKHATEDISAKNSQEVTAHSFLNAMAQMIVLVTHLIVEFAKCLPGFTDLDKDDQIVLLKAASTEVMAIRAARCYDVETKAIVFANGQPCTLENMLDTGLGRYAELVYEFCYNMTVGMQTDNAEYALMTAIAIFSERPGLTDRERVEELQSTYVNTLQSYESAKRGKGDCSLAKFLTRLSDLRSISLEHSSLLLDLQNVGSSLPTLVKEVFILPPEGS